MTEELQELKEGKECTREEARSLIVKYSCMYEYEVQESGNPDKPWMVKISQDPKHYGF